MKAEKSGISKIEELKAAGRWVLNIIDGVSKGGGSIDPMDDEPDAAFDALRKAIEE